MKRDLGKLPQWVQAEIATRDRQIATLKSHIEAMSQDNPGSNTKVSTNIRISRDRHGLPDGSEIEFHLGESREPYREMISAKVKGHVLEIMAHGRTFHNRMAVSPSSSNLIHVWFAEEKS